MNDVIARTLFGTDEPQPERRLLTAGPLTAVLEDGNLRDIRFAGVELVRAINYLARDTAWGTYKPVLANLAVSQERDRFRVRYDGRSGDAENQLAYVMEIVGTAAGTLTMNATATALTDFGTNRTGFVVLHPASVAGGPLTITHTDGSAERTTFPRLISPHQPAFDIAKLLHEPAPGMLCRVTMSGDAFEMEDQRNWSDASFKTYVRPLSKPRPYVLAKGTTDVQGIIVTVEGQAPAISLGGSAAMTALRFGEPVGYMPHAALFVDETVASTILPAGVARKVIVRLDPAAPANGFADAVQGVRDAGAELHVELVLDARNADAEAAAALDRLATAGARPASLLVSPRRDFKTRPSSLPSGEVSADALVAALRRAGFGGPIGAGTPSNFTEFNRNPPGPDCDFVYFSVCATVHASDDLSVVETLEAYPAILESARVLCPGKPLWLGSATIAPRHNPYGDTPPANPHGIRVPAAQADPRHGALFGAAFAIGIAAAANVELVALAAPTGPFGLFGAGMNQHPIFAVQQELAQAGGCVRLACGTGHPGLHAVAWSVDEELRMLVANLTPTAIDIALPSASAVSALGETGWITQPSSDVLSAAPFTPYLVQVSGRR